MLAREIMCVRETRTAKTHQVGGTEKKAVERETREAVVPSTYHGQVARVQRAYPIGRSNLFVQLFLRVVIYKLVVSTHD